MNLKQQILDICNKPLDSADLKHVDNYAEYLAEQITQIVTKAVEEAKPARRTIDNDHDYNDNFVNKGYNAGVADYSKNLGEGLK